MRKGLLKFLKIFLFVFGGSIILLMFFINPIANSLVKRSVEEAQENQKGTPYVFDVKDVHIDVWSGDLSLDTITLTIDKNTLDSIKKANPAKAVLEKVTVKQLQLKNISLRKALLSNALDIEKIIIESPQANVLYGDSPTEKSSTDFSALMESSIDQFALDSFIIANAKVIVKDIRTDSVLSTMDSFSFKTGKVNLNFVDKTNNFLELANNFKISIKDLAFNDFEHHSITTKHIQFDMSTTSLLVDSIAFEAKKINTSLYENNSYGSFKISRLSVSGFDKLEQLRSGTFLIKKIELTEPHLDYHLDAHYKNPPGNDPAMPHEALLSLSNKFKVDSLSIVDGEIMIDYAMNLKPPISTLSFTKISSVFTNINNLEENKTPISCDISCLFMNEAAVDIKLGLLPPSFQNFHTIGTIKTPITLTKFNDIVKNEEALEFTKNSQFDHTHFEFMGDESHTEGFIEIDYENVSIFKYKQDEFGRLQRKSDLFNLLANGLFRNNNKKGNKNFRVGHIDYYPPDSKSFFGILWKTLANGISDVIIHKADDNQNKVEAIKRNLSKVKY